MAGRIAGRYRTFNSEVSNGPSRGHLTGMRGHLIGKKAKRRLSWEVSFALAPRVGTVRIIQSAGVFHLRFQISARTPIFSFPCASKG